MGFTVEDKHLIKLFCVNEKYVTKCLLEMIFVALSYTIAQLNDRRCVCLSVRPSATHCNVADDVVRFRSSFDDD